MAPESTLTSVLHSTSTTTPIVNNLTLPIHSIDHAPVNSRSPSASALSWMRTMKPFAKKVRHFSQFDIQPDDPHRHYGPGDIVSGNVLLNISKPLDITHIVVCLHGFAQVYRVPNTPGESYRTYNETLITGKTNKGGGYYGNGFISLFEDEIVLCGNGRLEEGSIRLGFELQFPESHIPSSIDFERGTITYMITCTVTRPPRQSIINPIISTNIRLNFRDDIDIALLVKPRPRSVVINPLVKKSKSKTRTKSFPSRKESQRSQTDSISTSQKSLNASPPSVVSNSTRTPTPTHTPTLVTTPTQRSSPPIITDTDSINDIELQTSPVQSECSLDSTSNPSMLGSISQRSQNQRTPSSSSPLVALKPISANIQLNSSGYLPGDSIDVFVSIDHNKQLKSLHGIICTLYRQSRVDHAPSLQQVNSNSRKSNNPIGPLFSGNNSLHSFRKILDQNFGSIIINPVTLKTEVKVSLRLPDEVFATIATVPGAMISFKYVVEVICDLQGKLAGYDKYLPTPGTSFQNSVRTNTHSEGAHVGFNRWTFVDTEDIKREKSVVFTTFEIIVGTRDSQRRSRWGLDSSITYNNETEIERPVSVYVTPEPGNLPIRSPTDRSHRPNSSPSTVIQQPLPRRSPPLLPQQQQQQQQQQHQKEQSSIQPRPPQSTSPETVEHTSRRQPTVPTYQGPSFTPIDESNLSEKQRIQLAEQRLLPSAPPEDDDESETNQEFAPSVPTVSQIMPINPMNMHHHHDLNEHAPPYVPIQSLGNSTTENIISTVHESYTGNAPIDATQTLNEQVHEAETSAFGFASINATDDLPKYER